MDYPWIMNRFTWVTSEGTTSPWVFIDNPLKNPIGSPITTGFAYGTASL